MSRYYTVGTRQVTDGCGWSALAQRWQGATNSHGAPAGMCRAGQRTSPRTPSERTSERTHAAGHRPSTTHHAQVIQLLGAADIPA